MPVPWSLTLVNAAYDSEGQAVLLHWEPAPSNTGELTGTVTNYWQTLLGNQANAITLGYVVHAAEPAAAPQAVYINGQRCSLVDATPQAALQSALPSAHLQTSEIGENDTVAPPGVRAATRPAGKPTAEAATKASAEAATKAAAEAAGAAATIEAADVATSFIQAAGLQPMTTLDGQLLGVDGNPVYLHGVNWFGFELSTTMVDGLWQGPDSMTMDFATVIQRIQLLGFNAIRLPFSFPAIFDKAPISYTKRCTQVSPSAISASVVKPGANTNGVAAPQPAYAARQAPGICNAYLPNDSTFNRLIWVVNYLANNGFYVLLDNQFNVEQTATDNPDEWVQLWVRIMAAVTQASPQAAARTMVDIINEPDCQLVKWESAGGMPGAGELYLRVMEALSQVNAGTIFVIEGLGQQGYAKNWGDGLVTDPAIISKNGLSDPNPFFQSLMTQPYLSQVVIGPHLYPPSISTSNWGMTGPDLWNRLSKSFGYFNKGGYCTGATCHVFPVIIGEIGSSLADARDMPSLVDIRSWMLNVAPAADGQHNKVSGYFWWAWNANSGDTKGLVGDDWRSVVWNKIDFLTPLGLRPCKGAIGATELYLAAMDALYAFDEHTLFFIQGVPQSDASHSSGFAPKTTNPADSPTPFFTTLLTKPYAQQVVIAPVVALASPLSGSDAGLYQGWTSAFGYLNMQGFCQTGSCTRFPVVIGSFAANLSSAAGQRQMRFFATYLNAGPAATGGQHTIIDSCYQAVKQSIGLSDVTLRSGVVSGSVGEYWQVIWPGSGAVELSLVVESTQAAFMPSQVQVNGQACAVAAQT
ncbi:hypothetical protein WJX72_011774 [[Myrmecia] bisecta]|uniref:Glycoside hydrolase family 5 domain-containing protein n=1 Tax=[Myrmecia] bisecta TaxID=41462 RepID=A0AAW1P500_9CHLO